MPLPYLLEVCRAGSLWRSLAPVAAPQSLPSSSHGILPECASVSEFSFSITPICWVRGSPFFSVTSCYLIISIMTLFLRSHLEVLGVRTSTYDFVGEWGEHCSTHNSVSTAFFTGERGNYLEVKVSPYPKFGKYSEATRPM